MKKLFSFFIVLTLILSIYNFRSYAQLNDISNHWAKSYIESLIQKKVISGYMDGSFKPNNTITNAEFTKILITGFGYNELGNSNTIHWANNYINKAVSLDILKQKEFDNFDDNINRLQMAIMIGRILEKKEGLVEESEYEKYKNQLDDIDKVPSKDQKYIVSCYAKGIITGYEDYTFRGDNTATRAEAFTMMVRLLEKDKRIEAKIKSEEEIKKINEKVKLKETGVKNISDFKSELTSNMIKGAPKFYLATEQGKFRRNETINKIHIATTNDFPIKISDNYVIENIELKYEDTGYLPQYGNPKDYVVYVKLKALKEGLEPTKYVMAGSLKDKNLMPSGFTNFGEKEYFEKKKQYPNLMGRGDSPDGKNGLIMGNGKIGTIVNDSQATDDVQFSSSDYILIWDTTNKANLGLAIKNPLK